MTDFEEELYRALGRREPGGDFTARLMASVAREKRTSDEGRWFTPVRRWKFVPLSAALLITLSGVVYQHHAHVQQGEAAKQQLLVALRIAGSELKQTRLRVKQIDSQEVVQ